MPAKIQLTQEMIDSMINMRVNKHMSFTKIGEMFSVSAQTVTRTLQECLGKELENTTVRLIYDRYFFHVIDTAEKAYWLGFVTADGYVNERRNFL